MMHIKFANDWLLAMNVEMGEVKVCAKGSNEKVLETYGVSTCIAIMLFGTYDKITFILMDHWDGEVIGNRDMFIRDKLCKYITQIQDTVIDDFDPDIHEDIPVYIEKIVVIGGEKKQLNKHGELLVSGTESSVNLLKSKLITELGNHCEFTQSATQIWNNYLTSGNQSIKVQIDINGMASYVFENNLYHFAEDSNDELDYSPGQM